MRRAQGTLLLILMLLTTACAGGAPTPTSGENRGNQPSAPAASRTLTFITHVEPPVMSDHRALTGTGSVPNDAIRLFNASLFLPDFQAVGQPYLVEKRPELNTGTWKVNPDGTMETTYNLRPGITWHDGQPFTAQDMVFSWRVAKSPELGVAELLPTRLMDEVIAVDDRTLVVRWKGTYPLADTMRGRDWAPLPRHILESAFDSQPAAAFAANPYWKGSYVGLGPFKLDKFEPGAFLEGSAFDGHVLGRPKIDRVKVLIISDPNTAVANLLAGQAQMAFDFTLGFEQGALLKRQWGDAKGGSVLLSPDKLRYVQIQFRPEVANPAAILDPRVRKALAHAIDKQSLIDGLLDGEGQPAVGMAPPLVDYAPDVERAVTKYPYDVRQTERLLQEAGFTKGNDGIFVSASGERFSPELRATAGGHDERENAILADIWRRAGVDARTRLLSTVEDSDREIRANFPAFGTANTGLDEATLYVKLSGGNVPTPANRYAGSNRGGWTSAEYDRAYNTLTTNLDRRERVQAIVQASKVVSEEVPILPMYYNLLVQAHVAGLTGPQAFAPSGEATWDVQKWELR